MDDIVKIDELLARLDRLEDSNGKLEAAITNCQEKLRKYAEWMRNDFAKILRDKTAM